MPFDPIAYALAKKALRPHAFKHEYGGVDPVRNLDYLAVRGVTVINAGRDLTNVWFKPNIFHFVTDFADVASDRWGKVLSGTAAITPSPYWLVLQTGTTSGSHLDLYIDFGSDTTNITPFEWSNVRRRMRAVVRFGSYTNQEIFIGPSGIGSVVGTIYWTDEHVGFKVINDVIYGSVADGTAESTAELLTLTGAATLLLELDFIPGEAAYFYINGELKGSVTTNLPTGPMFYCPCEIILINRAAENKELLIGLFEAWVGG